MCLFSSMLSNAKSNRLGPFMPRSSTPRGSCLYKMDLSVEAFIKYALKLKKKKEICTGLNSVTGERLVY